MAAAVNEGKALIADNAEAEGEAVEAAEAVEAVAEETTTEEE